MTTEEIKIGTRLWCFDTNHRIYEKEDDGRSSSGSSGGPIYEKYFRERYVVGENKKSWLVSHDKTDSPEDHWVIKVSKVTMCAKSRYCIGTNYYTDQQKDDMVFLDKHKHNTIDAIRNISAPLLKQVMEVLNIPY